MGMNVAFADREADPLLGDHALAWARASAADMEWTVAGTACVEQPRGVVGSQVLEIGAWA